VYGGQRQYLPLRVNHGGVLPIIFASSLMIFPGAIFGWMQTTTWGRRPDTWYGEVVRVLNGAFQQDSVAYSLIYIGMIFFFAYFWTTIQFRPKEMADQLRDYGSFIPGLRPGKRTADYLERVMERITYCGAAFLAVIAVLPMAIAAVLNIPFSISAFLGGTGLLITVSVTLDLVQRIEANLVMRNYGGFLGGSQRIKGAYR
jgi:preprotein translocase subunit SecY